MWTSEVDTEVVIGGPDELLLDPGVRLATRRGLIDRGEAGWLTLLAEFDEHRLWSDDGQLSCVAWLVWRTKMCRGTAFEKVRIAHELRRRPVVAGAFGNGEDLLLRGARHHPARGPAP